MSTVWSFCSCTHRHLHFELILVKFEENIGERALQECGGSQNQNQLEVPRKGALRGQRRFRELCGQLY